MKRVGWVLLGILGAVPAATGGTIEGKFEGWSAHAEATHRPGVVWLEGQASFAPSKVRPVMAQRGGQFAPPFLVVVAGETVEMPNQDDVAHNVYSVSAAKSFNLGYYAKGDHKFVT